jgi:hypothetical protein
VVAELPLACAAVVVAGLSRRRAPCGRTREQASCALVEVGDRVPSTVTEPVPGCVHISLVYARRTTLLRDLFSSRSIVRIRMMGGKEDLRDRWL